MPSTPNSLFAAVGVQRLRTVNFFQSPRLSGRGVYIVSTSEDPDCVHGGALFIEPNRVADWLTILRKKKPTQPFLDVDQVVAELKTWWLPDESILYIGKATRVSRRVRQMRTHVLGYSKPHAGGHWLHALSNPDGLFVHVAEADERAPEVIEGLLIKAFRESLCAASRMRRDSLCAPEVGRRPDYFPFANLEWNFEDRTIKRDHPLTGYTVDPPTISI